MTSTPAILMLTAAIVALIALVMDVRARRIPNWLTASAVLMGLTANLLLGSLSDGVSGALSGALTALVGAALGFGLLFPFYLIRVNGMGHAIGAGDGSLLPALAATS